MPQRHPTMRLEVFPAGLYKLMKSNTVRNRCIPQVILASLMRYKQG